MTNKGIESNIRSLGTFLEFWGGFHSIYANITGKDIITQEDENKFLETKATIGAKYDQLNKELDFKYMPHGRLTDPVDDIFAMKTIRFMSENNLKRIEASWKDSYVFLNNIMEQLKTKKKLVEDFNPVSSFFRNILDKITSI
jgi:hypothetical protein